MLGAESPIPTANAMHAASTMPNAEVTVIPRAGHLPLYEQPGCVAAALSQFSQRLDRVPEVAG